MSQLGFRQKVAAAGAMIRDLKRRSWVLPEHVSGIAEYLPELTATLDKNRGLAEMGLPLRLPQVEMPGSRVTLIPLEALEIFLPAVDDAQEGPLLVEIEQRRRAIKRDGFDTVLRAGLIRKYGLRIQRKS